MWLKVSAKSQISSSKLDKEDMRVEKSPSEYCAKGRRNASIRLTTNLFTKKKLNKETKAVLITEINKFVRKFPIKCSCLPDRDMSINKTPKCFSAGSWQSWHCGKLLMGAEIRQPFMENSSGITLGRSSTGY
jgi:hypothetical protein